MVSTSNYHSSNSPLRHISYQNSSVSWWSFDLKFLESFYNNKFGISITTLSWFHLFNILVVSSIYLFPHEPEGRRKRFLPQKTNLSYIVSMVLDEIVLLVCDQGYLNVWEAVVYYYPFVTKDSRIFGKLLYSCHY